MGLCETWWFLVGVLRSHAFSPVMVGVSQSAIFLGQTWVSKLNSVTLLPVECLSHPSGLNSEVLE